MPHRGMRIGMHRYSKQAKLNYCNIKLRILSHLLLCHSYIARFYHLRIARIKVWPTKHNPHLHIPNPLSYPTTSLSLPEILPCASSRSQSSLEKIDSI